LQKLNSFTRVPDYIAYLAYILQFMPQEPERIRSIAGYLLKNNARYITSVPPEAAQFVKATVLMAFSDPSQMIRNAATQDIVTIMGIVEPKFWPEALQALVSALDDPDGLKQEVRFLSKHFIPYSYASFDFTSINENLLCPPLICVNNLAEFHILGCFQCPRESL
jgi:hypothetical protein